MIGNIEPPVASFALIVGFIRHESDCRVAVGPKLSLMLGCDGWEQFCRFPESFTDTPDVAVALRYEFLFILGFFSVFLSVLRVELAAGSFEKAGFWHGVWKCSREFALAMMLLVLL